MSTAPIYILTDAILIDESRLKPIPIDKDWWIANRGYDPTAPRAQPPAFDAPIDSDNTVSKIWGNIEVRGKVVAQIYNSGGIATDSSHSLPFEAARFDSPAERAQAMVKAYGGRLVMRSQMANPKLFMG